MVIMVTRLFIEARDDFFLKKFHAYLFDVIQGLGSVWKGDSVAQYNTAAIEEMRAAYRNILAMLEYFERFHPESSPTLVARARHAILKSELMFAREVRVPAKQEKKSESREVDARKKVTPTTQRSPGQLTSNQDKILRFIKSFPNARTKDIIDEFGTLSDRTVKRSLRELIQAGLVTKRAEHKAVFYSAAALH